MKKIDKEKKALLEAFLFSITGESIKGRDLDSIVTTIEAVINKENDSSFIVPMFGLTCDTCNKVLTGEDGEVYYMEEANTTEIADYSNWEEKTGENNAKTYRCLACAFKKSLEE